MGAIMKTFLKYSVDWAKRNQFSSTGEGCTNIVLVLKTMVLMCKKCETNLETHGGRCLRKRD